ncbi:MAG: glycosyltransferase family 2 protein [Thermoanaerobaculia bacterium]|nr:glycosyltransferase family 2 protein [Thermoanaerobaculia bacterium]
MTPLLDSALLDSVLLSVYYSTLSILAVFGTHRLLLVVEWWRTRHQNPRVPAPPSTWPIVTVQLPLYNERFVVERLLEAIVHLDYPRDRLEIQVLDDSTDETSSLVAAQVERWSSLGIDIRHLHRKQRDGFKAGALAAGMEVARGDLLCVFDADFVPESDFLRHLVPHFEDPEVGMVQARWEHLNREDSLLTQVQAILLDGHFAIEHTARNRSGHFFNFNGTGGIWRRQAIVDAGGWSAETLTEDLDLSYRAQLAGWRFIYRPDVTVPAELPDRVTAFKSQQHRWARGSIQTGRKLLPRILAAKLPLGVKAEALVHLTSNLSYPLMILLAGLMFPAMILRRGAPISRLLTVDAPLFGAATLSVLLFYLMSQVAVGRPLRRAVGYLPAVMATGIGLSVSNTSAVLGGLYRRGGVFHRTPKRGALPSRPAESKGTLEYHLPQHLSWWFEGLLAAYFLGCCALALIWGMWLSLPFLYLFLQGFTYLFLLPWFVDRRESGSSKPQKVRTATEP